MKKLVKIGSMVSALGVSLLAFPSMVLAAEIVELCPPGVTNKLLCTAELQTVLPGILNVLLFIAFIAALIFLIYGGIRWILSGGDKEGTARAKGTVTAALIGLAIVLGSWILVNIVMALFGLGQLTTIPTIFP